MKKILFAIPFVMTTYFFTGCHQNSNESNGSKSDRARGKVDQKGNLSTVRTVVKKEAVAEFKERTDNPLNNWYFSVRLFETTKTFDYVLKMQFEEIRGEDTLRLPNFGIPPKPELRKGKDKYSCIIGFLDRNNEFREYKLVYVKDGSELKLTTLNHYSIVSVEK